MTAMPSRPLRLLDKADRLAGLTDAERAIIARRRALVDAWRSICILFERAERTKGEATKVFLSGQKEPICQATLYNWARAYDSDDPTDILDRRSKSVRLRSIEQPETVSPAAWNEFKHLWLNIRRLKASVCWQIVNELARDYCWKWPSLRTVQRMCQTELPPYQSDWFRLGEKEWSRRHAQKIARDYSLYRSSEWVVGDFHEFDVFCRKSDTDSTIVRPLLSAFMDMRSRVLWGWQICLRENADNILLAFRRGCETYGVPDHVLIDNGKPYRSYGVSGGRPTNRRKVDDEIYVQSVFGGLEVCVHFSIPFNPDSKLIERWFGTLEMQLCATYESYCGGDKDDRFRAASKLAKDHPEKCPTVAQLTAAFEKYLAAYHATPHSGEGMDGMSPTQAFERCDPIARKVAPQGALDMLLLRTYGKTNSNDKSAPRGVKVTCNGLAYMNDYYGQREPLLIPYQGKEVLLRVDPNDAGWVLVCDLDGRPIVRAYNNRRFFAEVTQDNIRDGMKAKAEARNLAKSVMNGGMRPLTQDVTAAAIGARLASGQRQQREASRKTGTHDTADRQPPLAPRSSMPLRSDFTDALAKFQKTEARTRNQVGQAVDSGPSFEDDVAAIFESGEPNDSDFDLADMTFD